MGAPAAPAEGKGDAGKGAAAAAGHGDREGARPDRGPPPPVFNGQIGDYREFRKKVELYAARARGRDAEHTVGLDLMTTLTGRAWENVEDLDVARVSEPQGWRTILERLDACFKYDARTELPSDFENFFYKLNRNGKETLLDYVTRFRKFEKRIRDQEIVLPSKVLGWLLLRRSGITQDHRALVLSQVGKEITMENVEEQLKLCFGMDSLPDARPRTAAHYVEDSYYHGEN